MGLYEERTHYGAANRQNYDWKCKTSFTRGLIGFVKLCWFLQYESAIIRKISEKIQRKKRWRMLNGETKNYPS